MQAFPQIPARLATWCRRRLGRFTRRAVPPREEPLAPCELARVRRSAEQAADQVVHGEIAAAVNPWKLGTRRYVMWETSHHARLLAYEVARAERAAAAHAAGMKLARKLAAM